RTPETYSHGSAAPLRELPEDDPNHYALYRLFIIARFCAPPFPDALVETSRQRPSPAPEIGGRILALSVERAGECRTGLPAQYAIPAGRRLRPGDQDSLIQRSGRQSRRAGQLKGGCDAFCG